MTSIPEMAIAKTETLREHKADRSPAKGKEKPYTYLFGSVLDEAGDETRSLSPVVFHFRSTDRNLKFERIGTNYNTRVFPKSRQKRATLNSSTTPIFILQTGFNSIGSIPVQFCWFLFRFKFDFQSHHKCLTQFNLFFFVCFKFKKILKITLAKLKFGLVLDRLYWFSAVSK